MLHISCAQLTGMPLPHAIYYGKPNPEPYRLVEALLRNQLARLSGGVGKPAGRTPEQNDSPLMFSAIFAVRNNFDCGFVVTYEVTIVIRIHLGWRFCREHLGL